ncbi:hypothetical protein MNEG_12210 [Monoraphidium neglectum]|uniref:Phytanoyl-CoA dioxygenase n=1 Tax=Monoraphidium neglectum TaxID=145388 RepID=A0A0D2M344_9CHLO|nr:hypothetical protein MNEG_12210 [Monoraphidium neglectum]KIY95751.1 hypothetical protein MNEG_12210 [Monoraphidium neglectum]|eukprot:XP_013894771.1 hypothetical protein MNEG_12210 [Monoraphidium neglectum]
MAEWDPWRPLGNGWQNSWSPRTVLAPPGGGSWRCDDAAAKAAAAPVMLQRARKADLRRQIDHAGVAQATLRCCDVQVSAAELALPAQLVSGLARGVQGLLRAGWPASMIVMYDEAWLLIEHLSKPDDAAATFRADGSAMYTTAWVALTDAEPGNSCLYVVPSYADPGYREGDPEEEDAPDPLTRALDTKESYQHIRALPCPAGAAVLFTHRIIHWGSRGRPGHPTPRISLSFGCADDAYEAPYFDR